MALNMPRHGKIACIQWELNQLERVETMSSSMIYCCLGVDNRKLFERYKILSLTSLPLPLRTLASKSGLVSWSHSSSRVQTSLNMYSVFAMANMDAGWLRILLTTEPYCLNTVSLLKRTEDQGGIRPLQQVSNDTKCMGFSYNGHLWYRKLNKLTRTNPKIPNHTHPWNITVILQESI